jgi:3',5'-nucleoside bisphosphate phosphatase
MLADLHLHTVLSPCAEVEMIPPLIVRRALEAGLDLIAVTDHNAAANCAAVVQAAAGTGLAVLPGMELQTAEEVHVLCLFDTVEQALTWQGIVFDHLPNGRTRRTCSAGSTWSTRPAITCGRKRGCCSLLRT